VPAFALIAAIAVVGWRRLPAAWDCGARLGALIAAALGLTLAVAPATPLRGVVTWAVRTLPAGGFLRDSQKFVIPLALLASIAFGSGVAAVMDQFARDPDTTHRPRPRTSAGRSLGLALAILPVALAPTLAWGAGGKLHTASYPPSWAAVERITSSDAARGGILVLPWHAYVPLSWNGPTPVHQPPLLYFSRPVLAASALELGTATLPGEDPWAAMATPVVQSEMPLDAILGVLGVRYVLLEKVGTWQEMVPRLAALQRVLDAPDLLLYRGPVPGRVPTFDEPPAALVLAGDAVAVAVTAAALVMAIRFRRRRWPAAT
jgi:hypothetical protein